MFNTIFRKQFALYAATLVASFALIALGLVSLFQNYFVQKTSDTLVEQGKRLAASYVRTMYMPTISGETQLQNDVAMLGQLGANCIFVNQDAAVIAKTSNITGVTYGDILVSPNVRAVLESGEIMRTQGTLGGLFSENVLTVGYPIFVDSIRGQRLLIGAVLMNAPMTEVQQTTKDVIRMTVLCLLAALAFSFVLLFLTSKKITKPIFQINEAAKVIAAGDFEKRLNVKSRDEVGQLAQSFNNMAESLDNQERSRREFIANISHDLRSPLTSMRGFLTAIMDGTIPPEGRDKYLQIVLDESERLTKLANDILDINKIQSLEIELLQKELDINELIRKTVIMFEPHITSKQISLSLQFADERSPVRADEEKIQRVLYNLLDNAVKFTEAYGHIQVETLANPREGKVVVCVRDDGRGMAAEESKHVFERFFKADTSRGEDKKGSGLGLAIVRAFVKAHGEDIWLETEFGKGSAFFFTLSEMPHK